jgi:hypothetical protein
MHTPVFIPIRIGLPYCSPRVDVRRERTFPEA